MGGCRLIIMTLKVIKMAASVENVQSMIASMLGVAKESQEQELVSL